MKWTDYPTRRDFEGRRGDGYTEHQDREGDRWSDGPRTGTSWVVPTDGQGGGERTSGAVLVTRRGGESYRIVSENP